MFHLAYLVGSYISVYVILSEDERPPPDDDAYNVLLQLNIAHILVPVFNLLIILCELKGSFVLSKIFETVSVFQY